MSASNFPDNALKDIFFEWSGQRVSDAEIAASFVLIQSRLRHGKNWLQGRRRNPIFDASNHEKPFRVVDQILHEYVSEFREAECSLAEFCARFRIKSMREGAANVLSRWLVRQLPLFVIIGPLSAELLLQKQSVGKRCVSIFPPPCDWLSPIANGKPPLEFTLHDLDHASKFLDDDLNYHAQVGFFDCIHKAVQHSNCLKQLRQRDDRFERDFVYLMSDMNTHCAHQREYLKAISVQAFLRDEGLGANDLMSKRGRNRWSEFASEICEIVGFDLFTLPADDFSRGLVARGSDVLSRTNQ